MDFVNGLSSKDTLKISDIITNGYSEKVVKVKGAVHSVRELSEVTFIILRKSDGLIQCTADKTFTRNCNVICEGMTLEAEGIVYKDERAPNGFELSLTSCKILSEPKKDSIMPVPISKYKMNASLEAKLNYRPIALRNIKERAVFKLQEGIVRGFREFLYTQSFTEIHTPKIVAGNAEGGANVFCIEYFGKKAFLAQSPQFYKQMMVGVFDRVFETAPVFRAEKHNTTRHLNEYISLDLEIGYIDNFRDIMEMEMAMLQYTFELLKKEYSKETALLEVNLPDIKAIPSVRFDEAKRLVAEKYNRQIKNPYDLEPEEEALIGKYFLEEYESDFVFVTHYPSKKRPFYAMDDPDDSKFTLSFDLLYKGMEITTGGQRIHSYDEQIRKMISRGMEPEDFSGYLMIHKHGMPPHGGLGIGLERLTMRLLNKSNVREAAMFPRDVKRLEP